MSFHNHGLNGEPKGYKLQDLPQEFCFFGWFSARPRFHITQDKKNPLYYEDKKGRKWTTRREYDSDFASIPPPFDRIWSPSAFRLSGMLHDDGCRNGGLYQIMDLGVQIFVPLTRKEMDLLMEEMACCECVLLGKGKVYRWVTKHCIYIGVRIGAFLGFGKPEKKQPKHKISTTGRPIAFA